MHRRCLQALAFSILLGLSLSLRGDDQLGRVAIPGETTGGVRRLAAADKLAADGQWADAIDEYQRILDEIGDELVPVTPRSSVQARRLCHLRFAGLPADVLKTYREKVDTQAQKWLSQWESTRDPRWLRRIVDDAFCSTPAEQALDLLGDIAFERGDFDEADQWWRMIARPLNPSGRAEPEPAPKDRPQDQELVFPKPKSDPARIHAKQIVADLYRGDVVGARAQMARFREVHGKAEGKLAGRQEGLYADILKELSEAAPRTTVDDDRWPTFAGGFARQHILGRPPIRGLLEEPTWTWRLNQDDGQPVEKQPKTPGMRELSRSLAYHPVIVGDQVLVADARYVTAFDLRTGKRTVWYDLVRDGAKEALELPSKTAAEAGLGYTLSVADNLVFVRMGGPVVRPPATEKPAGKSKPMTRKSYLVCLNQAASGAPRQRWLKPAQQDETSTAMFEGTPVVHQGRVFVAVTRFAASTTTAIASFDADTGRERWRKPVDICEVQDHRMLEPRYRHFLLTVAGSKVICCSHTGAIVALDMDTGRVAWAARYPGRSDRLSESGPTPRSVAPSLYSAGKLFVAPADYDRVLCLDPETGRLLWESTPPAEVVHLLGESQGKLIVTTVNDIRALDVATGQTLRGWLQPEDGTSLPPFGRGILAGSWVCWPTIHGLRVLDVATGQPIDHVPYNFSSNALRGNLAATAGCLVAADTSTLRAYVAPRSFLEERRKDSLKHPDSAAARYALALAEMDAGLPEQALQSFARVERLETPALSSLARQARHQVLIELAQASAVPSPDKAADYLKQAAASEFPIAARLQALDQGARMWTDARQPQNAVAVWQSILLDDNLRAGCMPAGASVQRAGFVAEEHIQKLIKMHGAKIYETQEQEAKRLLADKGERRLEALARVSREFPNASVTPSALLELAKADEAAGRMGSAAATYRQAITRSSAERKAEALAGLARCLERQDCWQASRDTWRRLVNEGGERFTPVVMEQLRKPAYRSLDSPAGLDLKVPLRRTWHIPQGEKPWQLLATEGDHPQRLLFFCQRQPTKNTVSCREADSGKERWQQTLSHAVSWMAPDADLAVVAGHDGLTCLRAADGVVQWRWTTDHGIAGLLSGFSHFQHQNSAVYFLEGGSRIVALEVASGRVLWMQWAPAAQLGLPTPRGQFYSLNAGTHSRIVTQTPAGRLIVFDGATGSRLHDLPTSAEPWPRLPVFLDHQRVLIVEDHQQVVLFDLAKGNEIWRRRTSQPTVSGEAPTVVGVADGLLVLLIDGWQLEAVASNSGEPRWRAGNHLWLEHPPRPAQDLRTLGVSDAEAVYFTRPNVIHACSRADGRELWNAPLPDLVASWQILRTGGQIIVYPHGMTMKARPSMFLGGAMFPRPLTSRPQFFPLIIMDRKDGQLLQRLNFTFDAQAAVQLLEKGLVVCSGGETWRVRSD